MVDTEDPIVLQCSHHSKKFRLKFSCERTGDYLLELCKSCRDNESREFLIEEKEI